MWTPDGKAGFKHCASRLAMMSFLGISLYGGLGVCRVCVSVSPNNSSTNLQQPRQERDEIGPFIDVVERLQAAVDLSGELLVARIVGQKTLSCSCLLVLKQIRTRTSGCAAALFGCCPSTGHRGVARKRGYRRCVMS